MNRHTELRNLPAGSLNKVLNILDTKDHWEAVIRLIPKNLRSEHFELKYGNEQIKLMEKHAEKYQRKLIDVLFDEWGTSGEVRPTLDNLMKILDQANIHGAVVEVANLLGESPPPKREVNPSPIANNANDQPNNNSVEQTLNSISTIRSDDLRNLNQKPNVPHFSKIMCESETKFCESQPNRAVINRPAFAMIFDDSDSPMSSESTNTDSSTSYSINKSLENNELNASPPGISTPKVILDKTIIEDKSLYDFEYDELEAITHNFSEEIGHGAFGKVFKGVHTEHGALAVKQLDISQMRCNLKSANKIINTEVKSLSFLRHENIVRIFGYSIKGQTACIVCEYIDGGSLQQKIAERVLNEQERINIMIGTAEGLKYIHHFKRPQQTNSCDTKSTTSSQKGYYLHGDVKSANILLTKNYLPKLCDFGLSLHLDATIITNCKRGTEGYMAPECKLGTISRKNDIYSFGIVLLELLTGLEPIVSHGEGKKFIHIKDYIKVKCRNGDITPLLDRLPVDVKWTKAQNIYDLTKECLRSKNSRPAMDVICNQLYEINNKA